MRARHGVLFALMLLTACAHPTASVPVATSAEINLEEINQQNYLRTERAKGLVHGLYKSKPVGPRLKAVAARIAPAAVALCRDLRFKDPVACAYDITLKQSPEMNASATGATINISSGMVRFTEDNDDQLAMIIAHEMTHNFMHHVEAGKQNSAVGTIAGFMIDAAAAGAGYPTGSDYTKTGGQSGEVIYSQAFEKEADYIGLYLLARAGYDYHRVPEYWRKLSLREPDDISFAASHPSNAERYVVMRKTIAEIDDKKKRGLPLVPAFRK